jgi:hypothetical protein
MLAAGTLRGEPIISEFLASNRANLADDDGAFSDWLEIHNPDTAAVDLLGWYLTDAAGNLTKWRFPAVTLPPGGYLIVFASNKNRADPGRPLHTNFALSATGEYLGLVKPDGATVAFAYTPAFPAQDVDVSYGVGGRDASGNLEFGYFPTPTPGSANPALSVTALLGPVAFSREPGPFSSSFNLRLSGATGNQVIRYVRYPILTTPLEVPNPVATSAVYDSEIPINQSTEIRAAVFTADGTARGPVAAAHFTRVAPDADTFASKLPVLAIDTTGSGPLSKDGIDYPSWLYVTSPRAGNAPTFATAPDLVTPMTIAVRGHTSAQFPKRGYNLRLLASDGRRQPRPLLGLPENDRWSLIGPWKYDPSFIKNSFVYSLSNQIGRWAARTKFAEVFLDVEGDDLEAADYAGVHILTERIEIGPSRVAIAELSSSDNTGNALTGGYILKIDNPESNDFAWTTRRHLPQDEAVSLILVAPNRDDITPVQRDYIVDYVQKMEDALSADRASGFATRTYLDYIDRASWVDHHLLNTLVSNPDALEHSAYFTKPRGGRLQAGPVWDFDKALGEDVEDYSNEWNVWSSIYGTNMWESGWWGLIARDPEFMQDWVDRWQSLRASFLSDAALAARMDALAAEVGEEAAHRDAVRWPDNVGRHGGFAGQIEYQKKWLAQRAQWIDEQLVAPPTVTTSGSNLVFRAPAGAQLLYTTDGSDPRALGGAIAPNAIVATDAVTVLATANVHVRSYRPDRVGVFPGSPWSSVAGSSGSSPLSPSPRIVNLSSRAWVGEGEDSLFSGVVIADTAIKRYLSRAVGPGLAAFGAADFVPDPQLRINSNAGEEIFRNNGWQSGPDAAAIPEFSRSVGAFALANGSADAALATNLNAGLYTLQVSTPSGRPGVGLVELYELGENGRTINLSSRARVMRGDGVLIGGFVTRGPAYQRVLIRAVGPSLAPLGVAAPLVDPVLTLYSGDTVVATNDRWDAGAGAAAVRTASGSVGAFQLGAGSEDAALLITLPPGAYTAKVEGKNAGEGVALLEIYAVP